MQLTIIPADGAVYVDGKCYDHLEWVGHSVNTHALQWDGQSGWIEFTDGSPNETITELPLWAKDAIKAWEAENTTANTKQIDMYALEVAEANKQYPVANPTGLNKILSTPYKNLKVTIAYRESDMQPIGVNVERVSGAETNSGISGLLSVRQCTNDCIELGIPMLSHIAPSEGVTKDEFAGFLLGISPYNKIIYGNASNYVYQGWNTDFARGRKRTVISTDRDIKVNAGVSWGGYEFATDETSRSNLASAVGVVTTGGELPATFTWRTKDNINVPMTAAQLIEFNQAVAAHVNACYVESWARKSALDNLPAGATFDEIDAI
jgi:hypothetical protein